MYIHTTTHSLEQCVMRNPKIKNKKSAEYFLRRKLWNWLKWDGWKLMRIIKWDWSIVLHDWKHKIIYKKVAIWEVLVITYCYVWEMQKIERDVLYELWNRKKSRYRKV